MTIPPTGGRPKTADGHRDDAMLKILEFQGRVDAQIELEQRQYRERRAGLTAMRQDLGQAALSWCYGDMVERMVEQATA